MIAVDKDENRSNMKGTLFMLFAWARRYLIDFAFFAGAVAVSGCSSSIAPSTVGPTAGPPRGVSDYRMVSSFPKGNTLAQNPSGNMALVNGRLYGVARGGQSYADGVIFSATAHERPTTVYRFGSQENDGVQPNRDVVEVNGIIYGTTERGGLYGHGTIFSFNPTLRLETVLYNFHGQSDGGEPHAGLAFVHSDLAFYGTTTVGGANGLGGIFKFVPLVSIATLHDFGPRPDSSDVEAPLMWDGYHLWGVSSEGGSHGGSGGTFANGYGSIFRYAIDGNALRGGVFYNCDGDTMLAPHEPLATAGGEDRYDYSVGSGFNKLGGYIYRVPRVSGGGGKFEIVHEFDKSEGTDPAGGLLISGHFGWGVTHRAPNDQEGGGIYRFDFNDNAIGIEHVFTGKGRDPSDDGSQPASTPLDYAGGIYGTTRYGGAEGQGSVWAVGGN